MNEIERDVDSSAHEHILVLDLCTKQLSGLFAVPRCWYKLSVAFYRVMLASFILALGGKRPLGQQF